MRRLRTPSLAVALGLLVWLSLGGEVLAQRGVPEKQIPPSVLFEVRDLEARFDNALLQDCAPELCVSKGCTYRAHVVVDTPRDSSLPGLPQEQGPGSVPAQEYLTRAQCEFAHEESVSAEDIAALTNRLQRRLSKGWLQVSVTHQVLTPVSPDLSQAPPKPTAEPETVVQATPEDWTGGVALRELWVTLLPHFSWMIALLLVTIAVLTVIWALRRLGRESLEEKVMLAELANGGMPKEDAPAEEVAPVAEEEVAEKQRTPDEADAAYVNEQQQLWNERIAQAELERDESVVTSLLQEWLKAGEFALLLKALHVFGDKLSLTFPSDGELAARKVEFADYLTSRDSHALPSDAEFFRTLEHHAISSTLLAQPDADLFRGIREDFGSTGVTNLIGALPPRHGALLYAMVPSDIQHEVAVSLSPPERAALATQLLMSNRVSPADRKHLFVALEAARTGRPLPPPPPAEGNGIVDLGREFDAPGALSVLLTHMEAPARQALFQDALDRRNGAFPFWYFNILYPEMLLQLSDEARSDLLLEVDVKALAGWCSLHDARWQEAFLGSVNPAIGNAVRANMSFASRNEQLRLARLGQIELVEGLKRATALGKASFIELVA